MESVSNLEIKSQTGKIQRRKENEEKEKTNEP